MYESISRNVYVDRWIELLSKVCLVLLQTTNVVGDEGS